MVPHSAERTWNIDQEKPSPITDLPDLKKADSDKVAAEFGEDVKGGARPWTDTDELEVERLK